MTGTHQANRKVSPTFRRRRKRKFADPESKKAGIGLLDGDVDLVRLVRLGQVRLGQVRLGQVRLGQVRLGQVRLGQFLLQLAYTGVKLCPQGNKMCHPSMPRRYEMFERECMHQILFSLLLIFFLLGQSSFHRIVRPIEQDSMYLSSGMNYCVCWP